MASGSREPPLPSPPSMARPPLVPPRKRARVRQACNRCKARKIKCGNARPCIHCTSAGERCVDWRPGVDEEEEEASSSSAPLPPYATSSTTSPSSPPQTSSHHIGRNGHGRHGNGQGHGYGHGVPQDTVWPPQHDPDRKRYLAFPYDTIYRNELMHARGLSLSSGLSSLSYLNGLHKLTNEQMLDDLWSFLGDPAGLGFGGGGNELLDVANQALFGGNNTTSTPDLTRMPPANTPASVSVPSSSPAPGMAVEALIGNSLPAPIPQPSIPSPSRAQAERENRENREKRTEAKHNPWDLIERELPFDLRSHLIEVFLHGPYVLWPTFSISRFSRVIVDPALRNEPVFCCLVVAICAVASQHEERRRRPSPAKTRNHYDVDYVTLFNKIRFPGSKNTEWSSPFFIQALFYLANYCQGGFGPYGVNYSHSLLNQAVSLVWDACLHRSAETYTQSISKADAEEQRRTVWAVYCADKISAAYGRPVMLRLADMDIDEIDAEDGEFGERAPDAHYVGLAPAPTLRAYYRATIRMFCVLERVLDKINIPACHASSALQTLAGRDASRRPRLGVSMEEASQCRANHGPISFDEELQLLDVFQEADLPPVTRRHVDDALYHAYVERIRTTSSWIKMFIFRHLFSMTNTDLSRKKPDFRYASDLVYWSRELLMSQRRMIDWGTPTDMGPLVSYQISQTGRGLLPIVSLGAESVVPPPPSEDPVGAVASTSINTLSTLSEVDRKLIDESKSLLLLTFDLLKKLGLRSSVRSVQVLETVATRLDLDALIDEARPRNFMAPERPTGARTPAHEEDGERDFSFGKKRSEWIQDLPLDTPLEKATPTSQHLSSSSPAMAVMSPMSDVSARVASRPLQPRRR